MHSHSAMIPASSSRPSHHSLATHPPTQHQLPPERTHRFALSPAQLKEQQDWRRTMSEVVKLFGGLDANGDGCIELGEFLAACEGVGGLPKESELRTLFRSKDIDGNGMLDYDEFSALVESADARLKQGFAAIIQKRKEQLSCKWSMSRNTMLGQI